MGDVEGGQPSPTPKAGGGTVATKVTATQEKMAEMVNSIPVTIVMTVFTIYCLYSEDVKVGLGGGEEGGGEEGGGRKDGRGDL